MALPYLHVSKLFTVEYKKKTKPFFNRNMFFITNDIFFTIFVCKKWNIT